MKPDQESTSPDLSVIVPVLNGASFIAASLRDLTEHLKCSGRSAEIIVVDDGSRDDTARRVREAAQSSSVPVRCLVSRRNEGKGAAVRRGMVAARGRWRVFIDADLAYPPAEIDRLVSRLEGGADVAIASRVHPESRYVIRPSFFRYVYGRHLGGRLFNWFVRLFLLPEVRDSQAGLKGFTWPPADRLFHGWLPKGFSFDVALLHRARRLGLTIEQVPVLFRYDAEPTTVRVFRDALAVVRDVGRIRARVAMGWIFGGGEPAAVPSRFREALGSAAARAVLIGICGLALIGLLVTRLAVPRGSIALACWLVGLFAFGLLAWRADRGGPPPERTALPGKGELAVLAGLMLASGWLRLADLGDVPPMMHGDSAECGVLGWKILRGEAPDVFEFSQWYNTSYLSFVPYAASFALNGISVFALRLPSALLGIGSVAALYVLARTWLGARRALLAAALFAVSHAAIHFSRIGLWNIQVLFLGLLAFVFVARGLARGSAASGAAAGLLSGLALYSYTGGRLIPIVVLAFVATQLGRRATLRFGASYLGAMALTAAPLVLNYLKDPAVFTLDRSASVWVLAELNRKHVESSLGVSTTGGILFEQVRRTLAGFATMGDMSGQYGTDQPLLSPFIAVLALLGLAVAVTRWRDGPHLFLLLWLGLGLVLGSVMVIDPPSHTRLIVVFPVAFLFAAIGLDWFVRVAQHRLRIGSAEVALVCTLVVAQSAAFNLGGYYGFVRQVRGVPREWDVMKILDRFKGSYDYYLFTGPSLLSDDPVLRLFTAGTRTVSGFSEVDLPLRLDRDAAFIVMPDLARVGMAISERFPSVEREPISAHGLAKGFVYRCTVANGCRRGLG